jgi:RHS repeat-associated protein
MSHLIHTFFKNKILLSVFTLLVFSQLSYSQLLGPFKVEPNSTQNYFFEDGLLHFLFNWQIVGGTLISSSQSGTSYSAVVQWGAVGLGSVTARSKSLKLAALFVTIASSGPTTPNTNLSDENYIHSLTPRIATTNTTLLTINEKIESVIYFDGLGRAMQNVGIRAGGASEDITTHIEYDGFGRQVKNYLPYAATSTGGTYITDALTPTNDFYYLNTKYENTSNPYSEKELEDSPLNRILKQAAPGDSWKLGNGNEIEFGYLSNSNAEVRRYEVTLSFANNTYTPTLVLNTTLNSGYYNLNELYKTITKDENHDGTSSKAHTTEEFKDKQGRVVLKRTYGTSIVANGTSQTNIAHDTYYVYDEYGNLSYVLPPKSEAQDAKPGTTELSELCYQYKYDHRNRLVEKKIPGKGWEYIVYNDLDQPIMTQDQNLKLNNDWLFTVFDAFGRVAYTGVVTKSWSRWTMQNHINTGGYTTFVNRSTASVNINGTTLYYDNFFTNNTYIPVNLVEVQTINYYDDYNFDIGSGVSESSGVVTPITDAKGLATGSKVRVLNFSPVKWITTVNYYDDKGRPIYVYSFNDYLGTTDKVKSEFDFVGSVDKVTTTHTKSGNTITTVDTFTYDDVGRLLSQKQKINSLADETIVENTYDELGQLISKGVGGDATQARLQTVDYTYNIRGWLTNINQDANSDNDLFNFTLRYNNPTGGGTALYNGNISQTSWNTLNTDASTKTYTYTYDALNRITNAFDNTGNYNLDLVQYDKNGNIIKLKRQGHTNTGATNFGTMDDLTYSYDSGNKLMKVSDVAIIDGFGFKDDAVNTAADISDDYSYDLNGNMLRDYNKGISTNITYNHLNLPILVDFGSGDKIEYFYDASGVKLKKIVTENSTPTTTNYAGNYVYKDTGSGDVLQFFNHPEGYVEPDGSGGYNYIYQYKDHLGNIRLSYKDVNQNNPFAVSLQIQEENNYYPFGLKHKGYNNAPLTNHPYKYNGVELNESLDLNLYEMDFRSYDPAIARFTSIDPVTHFNQSTYTAFDDNPIFYADPSGTTSTAEWMEKNGITQDDLITVYQAPSDDETEDESDSSSVSSQSNNTKDNQDCCGGVAGIGYSYGVLPDSKEKRELSKQMLTEIVLFVVGEWVVVKVFRGGRWVYKTIQASRATKATMSSAKFLELLQPIDNLDEAVTLYRGLTGTETTSSTIFLTDSAAAAATYIQNGGKVVSYEISQFALKFLEQSQRLQRYTGVHGSSGAISQEFQFIGKELVKALNIIAK